MLTRPPPAPRTRTTGRAPRGGLVVALERLPDRDLAEPAVPAHQLPHSLGRVADVEQPPDQRLDPAQRPPLVISEPVRQRPLPSSASGRPTAAGSDSPATPAPGPQRFCTAVPPGLAPPPHRPFGEPQVVRDLADRVATGEPVRGLQPQPFTPLLLSGRIPATLRIPHAPVNARNHPTSRPARSWRPTPGAPGQG
jgi:hypothetical protein